MLNKITEEAAYAVGAKGAAPTEHERKLFEAWMRGHCWAVSGTWDGTTYVGSAENGNYIDPHVMNTRQLWAAWRDRGSLTAPACLHQITEPAAQLTDAQIDEVFNRLPDGATGFLKAWGYQQFARELLAMHAPAQPAAFAALFAARGALQHIKESGKPTESLLNEAIAAIDSVAISQAAPAAVAVPESATYPNPDEIRAIARSVSTSASDSPSPSEYVMAGYRAALAATQAATAPGKIGDHMQIRCRKCGEQATVEFNSARIVTHNPHTGKPRDERDIASDPEGKLIVAPGPLVAAPAPVVLPELMRLIEDLGRVHEEIGVNQNGTDESWRIKGEIQTKLRALLGEVSAPPPPAQVLGWVHRCKTGKIGNRFYTYEPHCDTSVRDDGGEKIAVIAATAPQTQTDARDAAPAASEQDARKSGCSEHNRYCHARMCLEGDTEHESDCPAGRAAIAAQAANGGDKQ